MRERYGCGFRDDGASFRQRRAAALARRPPANAVRLIRTVLLLVAPFALAFFVAVLFAIADAAFGSVRAMGESVCEESGASVVMPLWNFRHFDPGQSEDAGALFLVTLREGQVMGRSIALESKSQLERLPPFRWAWENVLRYRSPMDAELAYIPWCRKQDR